jgi:acyl carrier protein
MAEHLDTPALDEATISGRIKDFILSKLLAGEDAVNLTDTTPLVSGGIIDSLNSLKVGLFLEKAFDITVTPEELADPENLETVAAMIRLVTAKTQR